MQPRDLRWCLGAFAMPAAVGLLFVIMPRVTGVGWDATTDRVQGVPLTQIWPLVAVWAAGLWVHTFVLRAALPGLAMRRALALNLGGSSVSNMLPMGGAAGVGLNYAMLRSWGYSRTQISAFTAVSNLVVAVVKILIAVIGLVALTTMPGLSDRLPWRMGPILSVACAAIAITGATGLAMGTSRRGRAWARTIGTALRQAVASGAEAVRRGWRRLTFGGLGYPALQCLLLWLCLASVGAAVSVVAALVAYAVERLLTLVPLTPGGIGVVETVAVATLVAFGADPASAAAGVILFRVFSFLIEIPVGGIIALAWLAGRSRSRAATTPEPPVPLI